MRIPFEQMQAEFSRVFQKAGMSKEKAEICARIHTETSRDGISSHGAGRVVRFYNYLKDGWVDANAEPTLHKSFGALEVWDGNMAPGILNALHCTDRAIDLAKHHGIGLVGLRNTTHWMRGGSYGLYAAEKGYALISWTNTESCMPPWGGTQARLGNNPFVMALPSEKGTVLLDMAMTQYSFGKLSTTRIANKQLPYPGGFDKEGNLTTDPGAIEESMRPLPIGYWKGSAFAFVLDLLASVFSEGIGAVKMDAEGKGSCSGCSQVFIAIDHKRISNAEYISELQSQLDAYVKSSAPAEGGEIRSPGAGFAAARKDAEANGVWIDDAMWAEICAL